MVRVIGREGPLDPSVLDGITWISGYEEADEPPEVGHVECGLLADGSERVAMRHSHYPDGTVIVYTKSEWEAFVAGAKDGEFDFGLV